MVMKQATIAACLLVAACGGDEEEEEQEAPVAYADMTFEQRATFMNDEVMPQMKEVFIAFDAKYESMSCATCHGGGVTDGTYAMPAAELPVLPGTEEGFIEYAKDPEIARWSQFMYETVTPRLATLLQIPRYDPETHTGEFSCHSCHTLDGVEN